MDIRQIIKETLEKLPEHIVNEELAKFDLDLETFRENNYNPELLNGTNNR
jgi:hypothetical protein